MRRLILAALATLAATFAQGADLVFEGVGTQLIVPGERLAEVVPTHDPSGTAAVHFRLAPGDAEAFHALTRQLIGKPLAILVCGEELIHPVVREPIAGGVGIITQDSLPDALALTARLNGEAPCPEAGGS